jgi:aminopeptidase
VDARSPVGQAGVTFYETLFDENAASHIAFGQAYPGGVAGGDDMDAETLSALGVNKADAHLDVMIGSPTMSITATCADGRTVEIMRDGKFLAKVTGEESA